MAYISFIKDAANLILAQRAHPPSTSGMTHFKGPFILDEHVERSDTATKVEMADLGGEPITTASKGFKIICAPASTPISA